MQRIGGSRENGKGRIMHAQLNSNHVLENLFRNHAWSSEGDKIHPEGVLTEDSCVKTAFAGHASPVQH